MREFDEKSISSAVFDLDFVGIEYLFDGGDICLEVIKAIKDIEKDLNYYVNLYEEKNYTMGMSYIKLAKVIKYLNNKELIDKTLKSLKKINQKFELTPENIDIYANTNDLLLELNSREIGDIVTVSVTSKKETVESAYNTLLWLKDCGLINQLIASYNQETLSQGVTILQYADKAGIRLKCEACGKEKRISKFNVSMKVCKKCQNEVKEDTLVTTIEQVNKKETTEISHEKSISLDTKTDINYNNTKSRYMKPKKKSSDTEDKKNEYLSNKQEPIITIEQEDKELSQFIKDLYSNKLYITIDNSIDKSYLRNELLKYVETLKNKSDVDINIFKIIAVAKLSLNNGEILTNILHDLYLKNNNISEYINLKDILSINDFLSKLDDRYIEAFRYLILNNNWGIRSLKDYLAWLIARNILDTVDMDDFCTKAKSGKSLSECIETSQATIVCNICNTEVGIKKIRIGHNSCRDCNYTRKYKKKIEDISVEPKEEIKETKINIDKKPVKKKKDSVNKEIQSNKHSDIISNNIKDLKERSRNVELNGGNVDMLDEYMSRLVALAQYTNELFVLKTDELSISQLEDIKSNLSTIISTLIDKLESLEQIN